MSFNTGFYPVSTLWENRPLRIRLLIALGCGVVAYLSLVMYLNKTVVHADKIAQVSWPQQPTAEQISSAMPISQISEVASRDKPAVLTGFAANVKDVCRGPFPLPGKEVILLSKKDDGYVAVKTALTMESCKILLKTPDGTPVFTVADEPFYGIDSKPAYVLLNQLPPG